MEQLLDNFIRKVILRKYSWIENFEIKTSTLVLVPGSKKKSSERFKILYYVSPDKVSTLTRTDFKNIENLTENLFDSLGPKGYQSLGGIEFYEND